METVGSILPIHVSAGVGERGAKLVRKHADDNVVPRRLGDARAGQSVSSDLAVQQLLAQAAVKVAAAVVLEMGFVCMRRREYDDGVAVAAAASKSITRVLVHSASDVRRKEIFAWTRMALLDAFRHFERF